MTFFSHAYAQIFQKPPYPHNDFSGMTIMVTGANVGLGLEASKHFVRLGAAKVIVAVRSISKGEAAKQEIERQTGRAGIVDVWHLDYSSYASVKAFAARASGLERLDAAVLNAAITTQKFELFEDNESTVTVNVVSTTLLMLLLLPTLRATAQKYGVEPVLSVVGSIVHAYTSFPERNAPSCFDELNDPKKARMKYRYNVSKLLLLFACREIAHQTADRQPFVVVNNVHPGVCYTALNRNTTGSAAVAVKILFALVGWTAEEGSRTLVHGTVAGRESHGVFLSNSRVSNNALGANVTSPDGREAQREIWRELAAKLEAIQPGVTANL